MYFKDKSQRITFRVNESFYKKLVDYNYTFNLNNKTNHSLAQTIRGLLSRALDSSDENKFNDFNYML